MYLFICSTPPASGGKITLLIRSVMCLARGNLRIKSYYSVLKDLRKHAVVLNKAGYSYTLDWLIGWDDTRSSSQPQVRTGVQRPLHQPLV